MVRTTVAMLGKEAMAVVEAMAVSVAKVVVALTEW
jgi:hypothetical protein